jgi:hypothetical protein
VQGDDFFDKDRLGPRDVLDRLAGHRLGQEADEVTGMAGFHRDADLAVRLESTDARPMTCPRVDHHERATPVIDLHAAWWRNAHERVVDRSLKHSAVDDQVNRIVEDMRCGLGDVFAVLQSALTHDIEEQDTALPGIHQIFESGCKEPGRRIARDSRLVG